MEIYIILILTIFLVAAFVAGAFIIKDLRSELNKLSANSEENKTLLSYIPEDLKAQLIQIKDFSKSGNEASLETKGAIKQTTEANASFQKNLINQSKEIYEVLTNPIDAGRIGEISLENFLEKSELAEEHYSTQESYSFGEETYRPDAVIDLPGNTKIIIDAKTNTRNWMRAFQTEDLEIKENLISEAIENVKNTALNLSFKPYDQLDHIVVPNLIIMYMPLDTMYLELLKREGQDYLNDAYTGLKRRGTARRGTPILFTTPSLIGGLLRIIIWMWRERNARDDTSRMVLKMRDFRDNIRTFLKNFEDGAKSHKKTGDSLRKAYGNIQEIDALLEDMANYVTTEETTQLDPELGNNFNVTIVPENEN